jgi:hypothetical protein
MFSFSIIDFLFLIIFALSATTQISLVHSLTGIWNFFPLHLCVGLIIMHRYQASLGAIWFIVTAIVSIWSLQPGHPLSYLSVAAAGYFLLNRLFTTRSVYALLGLGLTVSALYLVLNLWLDNWSMSASDMIIFELQTIFGLYFGNLLARFVTRLSSRWLYVRGL